jgi:hypothetical protein
VTTAQTHFVVGIDIGQDVDYSAVVALEYPDRGERTYLVRHAQRFPLGTRFDGVVKPIVAQLAKPPLLGRTMLAIDALGVGAAVVEQIKDALPRGTRCHLIRAHAGDTVSEADGKTRVPKRDLVATIEVLLQNGRLRIAKQLPATDELVDELLDYRRTITDAGNDRYGSSSTGHDDLVDALSLACWAAEKRGPGRPLVTGKPHLREIPTLSTQTSRAMRGYDPWDNRDF